MSLKMVQPLSRCIKAMLDRTLKDNAFKLQAVGKSNVDFKYMEREAWGKWNEHWKVVPREGLSHRW